MMHSMTRAMSVEFAGQQPLRGLESQEGSTAPVPAAAATPAQPQHSRRDSRKLSDAEQKGLTLEAPGTTATAPRLSQDKTPAQVAVYYLLISHRNLLFNCQ